MTISLNKAQIQNIMQAILSINLSNLAQNYKRLQHLSDVASCAAVVKADAYGLGAAEVAQVLAKNGCETFFVALMEEGVSLRAALPDPRLKIYVLAGLYKGEEQTFLKHSLSPVLNSPEQVALWLPHLQIAKTKGCSCALHLDSGMARLGFQPEDFAKLPELAKALGDPLIMSHLCSAEERDNPHNKEQLDIFRHAIEGLSAYQRCFANSSGCFLGADYHFDVLRPGVALYGGNPEPGLPNLMMAVVSLAAPLLQIRELPVGATVGYNETWAAERPSVIGTLAFGYADGLLRSLHGKTSLFVKGQAVPMVGRVSMDFVTVDLTGLAEKPDVGDMVELIGPNQSIDNLAAAAGTIGYEVLTSLGRRYQRVYL